MGWRGWDRCRRGCRGGLGLTGAAGASASPAAAKSTSKIVRIKRRTAAALASTPAAAAASGDAPPFSAVRRACRVSSFHLALSFLPGSLSDARLLTPRASSSPAGSTPTNRSPSQWPSPSSRSMSPRSTSLLAAARFSLPFSPRTSLSASWAMVISSLVGSRAIVGAADLCGPPSRSRNSCRAHSSAASLVTSASR